MDNLLQSLNTALSLSNTSLTLLAILAAYLFTYWTKVHPAFDLSDLITGPNGKVSAHKFGQTGAWVVSSWGFVTLIQQNAMTEYYFLGYMGVWAGLRAWQDRTAKVQSDSSQSAAQ